jgi:hypothetical protein
MIVTVSTKGKGIRPIRFQGIGEAAALLGVTREHLYHVIRGARRSPRIEKWLKKNLKGVS